MSSAFSVSCFIYFFFFFNDTATTEIYTLSLHDALPISRKIPHCNRTYAGSPAWHLTDRKSTRLNSSHSQISYAVFCLKKKKKHTNNRHNSAICERGEGGCTSKEW